MIGFQTDPTFEGWSGWPYIEVAFAWIPRMSRAGQGPKRQTYDECSGLGRCVQRSRFETDSKSCFVHDIRMMLMF